MSSHLSTPPPRPQRLVGRTSAVLLLGMLAGLWAGQCLSAATLNWTTPLTIAGLMIGMAWAKFSEFRTVRAKQRASRQAACDLERRLKRLLIPQRHMIAHANHAHRPHKWEEPESAGMPLPRRDRAMQQP